MKTLFKLTAFLLVFILPLFLFAQTGNPVYQDEGMDLFLLVLASIFMFAIFGAAIIGAFLASFAIILFFTLTALGMVSTSVAIGIYKRSFTAGFKSFFLIFFAAASAALGTVGLLLLHLFLPLNIPTGYLAPIGFLGGLAGGLLLGNVLFYIVKELIATAARRLKLI
jgi:hypothetical protein